MPGFLTRDDQYGQVVQFHCLIKHHQYSGFNSCLVRLGLLYQMFVGVRYPVFLDWAVVLGLQFQGLRWLFLNVNSFGCLPVTKASITGIGDSVIFFINENAIYYNLET